MRTCNVDGCCREAKSKGMCDKHYRRTRKYGDPLSFGSRIVDEGDDVARFNAKFVRGNAHECWNWQGGTRPNGKGVLYGRHHLSNGSVIGAHRFAFQQVTGVLPVGMFVCHTCDNPLCVNPSHLFLGNHADNMRDMVAKGRSFKGAGENKKGRALLTNEQATELRMSSLTERELGIKYGMSAGNAGHIRRGKSYRVET